MQNKKFSSEFRNVTVLSIFALTVVNVLLMLKLFDSGCTRIYFEESHYADPEESKKPVVKTVPNASPVFKFDPHLGRWDNKRRYKMLDHVLVGTKFVELSKTYSVCLATQSSIDKAYSIIEVSRHWTGPISFALFVEGDEELAVVQGYIGFLLGCFPTVKERISFHLAFPKEKLPTTSTDVLNSTPTDCQSPLLSLNYLLNQTSQDTKDWRRVSLYPQNHMRNLARKNCQSDKVFLTDVDIVPSLNMADELNKFFPTAKCDGNCAYVVPTYELDPRVPFPMNKLELMDLANRGSARPFHQKVFTFNSFATNFTRWAKDTALGPVHVSHPVTNFKFFYEPFYVADDTVPPHDERFIGYGLTKNTQVYEMHLAGYKFVVISPIFTVHWGLQNDARPPWCWREKQMKNNQKMLAQFKREIRARHAKDTKYNS